MKTDAVIFELLWVIVKRNLGSKILKSAKKYGVRGGTIVFGRGTGAGGFLKFLELADVRKEIVLMIAERPVAYKAMDTLCQEFKFDKPNHGIAFCTKLTAFIGSHFEPVKGEEDEGDNMNYNYNTINVIVDKGKAELVIDAALKAGARGGTIINARGSGIHETCKLFGMDIEPEKEIALIVSEKTSTDGIVEEIKKDLDIEKPGNGIIFVQDISRVCGMAGMTPEGLEKK